MGKQKVEKQKKMLWFLDFRDLISMEFNYGCSRTYFILFFDFFENKRKNLKSTRKEMFRAQNSVESFLFLTTFVFLSNII